MSVLSGSVSPSPVLVLRSLQPAKATLEEVMVCFDLDRTDQTPLSRMHPTPPGSELSISPVK
jgi:hypothetical protein